MSQSNAGRSPLRSLLIDNFDDRYPTSWLMGRGPSPFHRVFTAIAAMLFLTSLTNQCFQLVSPVARRLPLLTRPPPVQTILRRDQVSALISTFACVNRAASVHPDRDQTLCLKFSSPVKSGLNDEDIQSPIYPAQLAYLLI